ncbi:MAG: DNA polymerase I, partial [Clostridia bacterium]|nr:DNA polymerase I [Clostridia bacterium]
KAVKLSGDVEKFLRENEHVISHSDGYFHAFAEKFGDIHGLRVRFDLFLSAYVLDSQNTKLSLSALALIFLKENYGPLAASDQNLALHLTKKLYPVLKEKIDSDPSKDLYYETELPLAYTLAKMEQKGFAVSREGIEDYGEKLKEIIRVLGDEIYALAGEEFLISSPKQLGKILFEKLSLPAGKKTKTGYATDAETLGKLRFHSPIIDLILNWRAASKLYSTYVEGMLKEIREDGRIHTHFNQRLTATGRLSSTEPNLQNIPVKTEMGREMRRFFTAGGENNLLIDADYSQIELRLLAHMSGDETMQKFFLDGRDIHTKTASEIFHVTLEEVTPEMRKSAKAVNFGIVYGIGEYSLSQDLGVPMRVAKEYIEKYFALFPNIRSYLDSVKKDAHETGFVTTLFGRKRFIPELKAPKKQLVAFGERVAMNAPIQGTAADIIKMAMVRVDKRLEKENLKSVLILQVHDELIIESPEEEAEYVSKLLSEEMENVVNFAVPLIAESQIGKTWYDAK